jgi:hypothetical protein
MSVARALSFAHVESVVIFPTPDHVRVRPGQTAWALVEPRFRPEWDHFGDPEVSEDAVMSVPAVLVREEPEEQEYVPGSYALVRKMALRDPDLPESADAGPEHRILVTALIRRAFLFPRRALEMVAQAQRTVGRANAVLFGRDW